MTIYFDEFDDIDEEPLGYTTRRLEFIGKKHRFCLWFDEDEKEPHGWHFVCNCGDESDAMSYGELPEEFFDAIVQWVEWHKDNVRDVES